MRAWGPCAGLGASVPTRAPAMPTSKDLVHFEGNPALDACGEQAAAGVLGGARTCDLEAGIHALGVAAAAWCSAPSAPSAPREELKMQAQMQAAMAALRQPCLQADRTAFFCPINNHNHCPSFSQPHQQSSRAIIWPLAGTQC